MVVAADYRVLSIGRYNDAALRRRFLLCEAVHAPVNEGIRPAHLDGCRGSWYDFLVKLDLSTLDRKDDCCVLILIMSSGIDCNGPRDILDWSI